MKKSIILPLQACCKRKADQLLPRNETSFICSSKNICNRLQLVSVWLYNYTEQWYSL